MCVKDAWSCNMDSDINFCNSLLELKVLTELNLSFKKKAFKSLFSLLLQSLVQQHAPLGIFFFVSFILNSCGVTMVKHRVAGRAASQIECLANCFGI